MGQLVGRYELHEKLGEGGMAEVYRASQLALGRDVAIKFIKTMLTEAQFAARFQREAKAVAQLNHPNILQVYDFDRTEDGRYFMVTEFLRGNDLANYLDEKTFSLGECIGIVKAVAQALGYAHQHGIIHRDVKPSNIFLTDDERIILTDFGVAKMLSDGSLTETGMTIGTPHYFAPEQGTGQAIDHRADLYALGVVFYELLTGETPYKGDTTMSIIAQHINAPIPDPRQKRSALPPLASQIVQNAMAKKPEDRYPDARALIRDLDELAKTPPDEDATSAAASLDVATRVEHKPTTRPRIALDSKWRRWSIIGGLAAVVAIIIGVGAFLLLGGNDEKEIQKDVSPALSDITPAAANEILVIVANIVGDENADVDASRYIAAALETGDLGLILGKDFRLATSSQEIASEVAAEQLAAQTNAQLVVWGVMDAAALQITLQAYGYPEDSLDRLSFSVPRNTDFGEVLVDDVPPAVSIYAQALLMQRLVMDERALPLIQVLMLSSQTLQGRDLRITPASALDRFVYETAKRFSEGEYEEADQDVTGAITLKPNDLGLYFWRYSLNAILLNRPERAQADVDKLRELIPDSQSVIFADMFIPLISNDYERVAERTNDLPVTNSEIAYVIMAYRWVSLCLLGDFQTAQTESDLWFANPSPEIASSSLFALVQTMPAFLAEVRGDTELFQNIRTELSQQRLSDLSSGAFAMFRMETTPVAAYLFGGYVAEIDGNTTFAKLVYNTTLAKEPLNFLAHWRQAVLDEQAGDYQLAYDHYQTALDNLPAPFPLIAYQQAQIIHAHGDAIDAPADACERLTQAAKTAQTDAAFYSILIEKISAAKTEFACD